MKNMKFATFSIIMAISLSACMPHTSRDYFKPSYANAEYEEGECSTGPDEYVVITTLNNVKVKAKANKHEQGAEVIVLLDVPNGAQANFTDNSFQVRTSTNSIYYYTANPDEVEAAEIENGSNQYKMEFVARIGAVNNFYMLVPPLAVGKKIYSFKSIVFENTRSGWGISALNCE